MSERYRPDPIEFQRCVSYLCLKVETIARGSDILHVDCPDLEGLLAAIPPRSRDRVLAMLNDIAMQSEHEDPAMTFAARYTTRLAQDIWRPSSQPLGR
jgi:hypothetical protein